MTEPIYHVTQEVPCRFCGGKGKGCYACQGSGAGRVLVGAPVSVLVWQDAKTPPAHGDLVLLAFRGRDGVIGVHIARYFLDLRTWVTAYTMPVSDPIAYAELTIPAELAEVTK